LTRCRRKSFCASYISASRLVENYYFLQPPFFFLLLVDTPK
jgi:hypothetical protein